MCKELNVDPNMIFAIALHESGFEADAGLGDKDYNGSSTASGYMKMLDSTWNHYASPNGAYYKIYIDLLNKYDINLQNKNDPKANFAVGICCYAQCKKEKGNGASLRTIVGYYGEGYNAGSTLEIIEYYEIISNHLNSLFEL